MTSEMFAACIALKGFVDAARCPADVQVESTAIIGVALVRRGGFCVEQICYKTVALWSRP